MNLKKQTDKSGLKELNLKEVWLLNTVWLLHPVKKLELDFKNELKK